MSTLSTRLIEAREESGMTQAQLAKAAGVKNQSTIGMIESGERKSSAYIPAIAFVLGVESLWLSEGRGPKSNNMPGSSPPDVKPELDKKPILDESSGDDGSHPAEAARLVASLTEPDQIEVLHWLRLEAARRRHAAVLDEHKKK